MSIKMDLPHLHSLEKWKNGLNSKISCLMPLSEKRGWIRQANLHYAGFRTCNKLLQIFDKVLMSSTCGTTGTHTSVRNTECKKNSICLQSLRWERFKFILAEANQIAPQDSNSGTMWAKISSVEGRNKEGEGGPSVTQSEPSWPSIYKSEVICVIFCLKGDRCQMCKLGTTPAAVTERLISHRGQADWIDGCRIFYCLTWKSMR